MGYRQVSEVIFGSAGSTEPLVVAEMGADPVNSWILDIGKTQAAGSYLLSQAAGLQGIIVPSVAFLDDHARFNVVVFRDAIDPGRAFGSLVSVMEMVLSASGT